MLKASSRSTWTGAISFGMVNIPVKLYGAVSEQSVSFKQFHYDCWIDDATPSPVGRQEICRQCEQVPERSDIQRGYVAGSQVVLMAQGDFDGLPVPTLKAIQVVSFVDVDSVDIRHLDKPYYLVPDEAGGKAFALLLRGMEQTQKAAVAKLSMRNREHLTLIRPEGDSLLLHTMFYENELRSSPPVSLPEISATEMDLASQLISAMEGEWQPEAFEDEYQLALMRLIEAKVAGTPLEIPDMPEVRPTVDLTAGLVASIQAAKKQAA